MFIVHLFVINISIKYNYIDGSNNECNKQHKYLFCSQKPKHLPFIDHFTRNM